MLGFYSHLLSVNKTINQVTYATYPATVSLEAGDEIKSVRVKYLNEIEVGRRKKMSACTKGTLGEKKKRNREKHK